MKKILKKDLRPSGNAVRYFSNELTLTFVPQEIPRGSIHGHPTVCLEDNNHVCQLG